MTSRLIALTSILSVASQGHAATAFVPSFTAGRCRYATAEYKSTAVVAEEVDTAASAEASGAATLSAGDLKSRLASQLDKMKAKDQTSKEISKEDLKVVYEDDYMLIVNKPSGTLSVSNEFPSLAKAVFDAYGNADELPLDKMVVHRLGMDTSGLMVFARTMDAVRGLNMLFRTRKIQRVYEVLVAGHVSSDDGIINLPLMRDYECPPFMRVATQSNQMPLLDLEKDDLEDMGYKKLVERPKASLTKYTVVSRDELDGQQVTRLALTSISGRTHQLNVHCAAFGHPIVGDMTYGPNGDALPQGGLTDDELAELIPNDGRVSVADQSTIVALKDAPCVHAKSMSFRHPVTKEDVSVTTDSSF
jgi:tRNA pseudouridine32 synthase/23S rRNA pseudouridine746 synthase